MIWIELSLSVLALVLAFFWPELGSKWFEAGERRFGALARRRVLSILLVGILALAARIAVLPILPIPQPRVDDEFSYLFSAATFARGRLTNPTPPMASHFQTLAELVRPTYQSIAPPAQGLALALGKVLFGKPFWGVWLSMGLMCAAICWALQGWLSPEWALLGGLIAVMRWGIFSYWADSYWGGTVAAIGGALVFGALPRIVKSPKARDALLMGLGLAILANSRPYEGLVFSLPVAVALLIWLLKRKGAELGEALRRVVLPLVLLLLVMAAAMGYYNWRITGHPLLMPHQLYNESYDPVPPFIGLPLGRTHGLVNPVMRNVFLKGEMKLYRISCTAPGVVAIWMIAARRMWVFFLGPALTLPLVLVLTCLPYGLSLKKLAWEHRFLLCASAVSLAGLALELYGEPHYAAPMTVLLLAVLLLAMRVLRRWRWRGRPSGLFLTRAVPVILLAMLVVRAGAAPLGLPVRPGAFLAWYSSDPKPPVISRIRAEADELPGRQLVIVRYGSYFQKGISGFDQPNEWAWNSPDITQQRVVWADGLGREQDGKLIRYFKGRHVWLLNLGDWPPKLTPYRGSEDVRRPRVRSGPSTAAARGLAARPPG